MGGDLPYSYEACCTKGALEGRMTRSRKWFCEFACYAAIVGGTAWLHGFVLLQMYFDSTSVDTAELRLALLRQLLHALSRTVRSLSFLYIVSKAQKRLKSEKV